MERKRPRIVHLITRLDLGGAQQNTLYCARHHDRERYEVGMWAGAGGRLDAEARLIERADVRLLPWLVHPISPARDAAAVARLAGMLADVDLLHTHSSKAGILGRAAARIARVPVVVHTVHGWSFNATQGRTTFAAYLALERLAARATDLLVCVSESDRRTGLALGIGEPSRYRVLRSGIDTALYAAPPDARRRIREELGIPIDAILVGSIGNLKAQKAPLDLVETARRAHARDPRLRFVVAGDGELRPEVERAIAAAGLTGIVRLVGWWDDVPSLLAALDVFVLTSRFEGLPRAALQAIAAGVPVVATDTGGISEVIISGESGLLVPIGDPESASDAIVRLAGEPSLRRRMSKTARMRLGASFDIGRMLGELESHYDELLRATIPSHLGARPRSH